MKRIALILFPFFLQAQDIGVLDSQANDCFTKLIHKQSEAPVVEQLRVLAGNTNWYGSPLRPYAMGIYACSQATKENRQVFDQVCRMIGESYPKSQVLPVLRTAYKDAPCESCPSQKTGCISCGFSGKCQKCKGVGILKDHDLKKFLPVRNDNYRRELRVGLSVDEDPFINGQRYKTCDLCLGAGVCRNCSGKKMARKHCSACNDTRIVHQLVNAREVLFSLTQAAQVIYAGSTVQRQTLAIENALLEADLLSPEQAFSFLTNAVAMNPDAGNLGKAREQITANRQSLAVSSALKKVSPLSTADAVDYLTVLIAVNPKATNLLQARLLLNKKQAELNEIRSAHDQFLATMRTMKPREVARTILLRKINEETRPDFREEMKMMLVDMDYEIRQHKILLGAIYVVVLLGVFWVMTLFFR